MLTGWLNERILLLKFICEGTGAFNIKYFSSQSVQTQCRVSQAVSLLILSGSVGQIASTINLMVFILSTQFIEAVNTCDELAAIVLGNRGTVGVSVVKGPVPFTLYFIAVT